MLLCFSHEAHSTLSNFSWVLFGHEGQVTFRESLPSIKHDTIQASGELHDHLWQALAASCGLSAIKGG